VTPSPSNHHERQAATRRVTLLLLATCLGPVAAIACANGSSSTGVASDAGGGSTDSSSGAIDATSTEEEAAATVDASLDAKGGADVADVAVQDSSEASVAESGAGACPFISGLVAYYPFNGNANDLSGNGYNAATTDVTVGPGVVGAALLFNGTTSGVQATAGTTSAMVARTFCAWVSPSAGTTGPGLPVILSGAVIQPPTSQADQFSVAAASATSGQCTEASPSAPFLDHFDTACIAPTLAVTTGQWNFVCYEADGTDVTFYVNGTPSSPIAKAVNVWEIPLIAIGTNPPVGGTTGPSFNGGIDEVTLWSRVLAPGELAALYNSGAGCVVTPQGDQ
jgi:hypothetical protein